jgi:hypothetical protein
LRPPPTDLLDLPARGASIAEAREYYAKLARLGKSADAVPDGDRDGEALPRAPVPPSADPATGSAADPPAVLI